MIIPIKKEKNNKNLLRALILLSSLPFFYSVSKLDLTCSAWQTNSVPVIHVPPLMKPKGHFSVLYPEPQAAPGPVSSHLTSPSSSLSFTGSSVSPRTLKEPQSSVHAFCPFSVYTHQCPQAIPGINTIYRDAWVAQWLSVCLQLRV